MQNLVKWGANLGSPTSTGNTALHVAIQYNQTDAVKTLLALEADINIQNHNGNTPLHLCAELGDKKMTTLLLESGQPYEASLNNVGDSPKDIAVQLGNKEVAELIPTPMVVRKQSKKASSETPGSPKRAPKHRPSTRPKQGNADEDKDKTDSLERPVRVVVQPPSVDNLLASETGSSLSSLWLPAPSANENLPMDVYWQKNTSPSQERKARNFENITDLTALKEIKKSDHHSHSDGSSVKSPRYQIRKKRRKYVTDQKSSKQKSKLDEGEIYEENEKETKRVKDPNTAKLFKKKKQVSAVKKSSIKKLKRVDEQREEEEYSIASPVSQNRSEATSGLASPRVRGRAELKVDFMNKLKESESHNGDLALEQNGTDEQRQQAKGLREFLKNSLVSRKSPANTDEGSSSKTGTLERKKGKNNRLIQAELKEHMKLTPKDIDALIKMEALESMKSSGSPPGGQIVKEKKPGKKVKKKTYEESKNDEEIVIIRLDPALEMPKKSRRSGERKSLENGVSSKDGVDTLRREKSRSKGTRGADFVDTSFERGTLGREGVDRKGEKSKATGMKSSGKREKKLERKDWPKFEVMVDETCEAEPGPSGKSASPSRSFNQSPERTHRSSHQNTKKLDTPSKESTFEMIHKLEKRFKHFLKLTTERLDEQKQIDNKHYSDLKNDITSMEKNIERTTRNSTIEILDNVTKELDCTMRKWAKALKGVKLEERRDLSSSTTSSTYDIVRSCEEEGKVITKAIVQRSHPDKEDVIDNGFTTSTPVKIAKVASKVNGHVVREAPDEQTEIVNDSPLKEVTNERAELCSGCEHDGSVEVIGEGRAAPQGRSDESSPCLQNRFPGDGDHMSLEKWYQEQLKQAEERWRIKAETDQQALRNRIKELEDTLFEFTGTHNTMV